MILQLFEAISKNLTCHVAEDGPNVPDPFLESASTCYHKYYTPLSPWLVLLSPSILLNLLRRTSQSYH